MDLCKCEKRHVSCVNLHIQFANFYSYYFFATFACHFEYRVNWQAKSLQKKSILKIDPLNVPKKYARKLAR